MTGSTLSGNTATTSGGAIFNLDTLRLTLSTLAGNTASGSGPDLFGPVTTDGGGNGAIGGDPERATREEISTPPPPLLQPRGTGALQGRTGVG